MDQKKFICEVFAKGKHFFCHSVVLGATIKESNIPVSLLKRVFSTPNQANLE